MAPVVGRTRDAGPSRRTTLAARAYAAATAAEARAYGLRERRVDVGDCSLAVLEGGRADGPAVVLLHGYSADRVVWVRFARHLLRDWLELVPVEPEAVETLLLVVSELCSNAVRHATGAPGSVLLTARAEDDAVVIEVSDDGGESPWNELAVGELPDPEAEQGRGLFLVRELSDEVSPRVVDGRHVVRVVKRAVVGVEQAPLG